MDAHFLTYERHWRLTGVQGDAEFQHVFLLRLQRVRNAAAVVAARQEGVGDESDFAAPHTAGVGGIVDGSLLAQLHLRGKFRVNLRPYDDVAIGPELESRKAEVRTELITHVSSG